MRNVYEKIYWSTSNVWSSQAQRNDVLIHTSVSRLKYTVGPLRSITPLRHHRHFIRLTISSSWNTNHTTHFVRGFGSQAETTIYRVVHTKCYNSQLQNDATDKYIQWYSVDLNVYTCVSSIGFVKICYFFYSKSVWTCTFSWCSFIAWTTWRTFFFSVWLSLLGTPKRYRAAAEFLFRQNRWKERLDLIF